MADLLGDRILVTDLNRYTRVFDLSQAPDMIGLPSGHIPREDLRKITPGSSFELKGKRYYLLSCDLQDFIMNSIKRNTQIVYPKDSGYIILKLDVAPGKRIGEAGTGSGSMTALFSRFVGPEGRVFTYEHDIGLVTHATKTLKLDDPGSNVKICHRSLEQGIDESDLDAFFLDVREPWKYLKIVYEALKPSGHLCILVPTTNQVSRVLQGLLYWDIWTTEVTEILLRTYKQVPGRLRPEDRMIAHTGFLIFGRKLLPGSYRPYQKPMPAAEEEDDADGDRPLE
jgi:tRNA (adenine57-N1/adenine58-N1)-methyltransferase catalytic subunit